VVGENSGLVFVERLLSEVSSPAAAQWIAYQNRFRSFSVPLLLLCIYLRAGG